MGPFETNGPVGDFWRSLPYPPKKTEGMSPQKVPVSTSVAVRGSCVRTFREQLSWSSWWLNQPIWNICSSNCIISPGFRVKIKKIFELPPPSDVYINIFQILKCHNGTSRAATKNKHLRIYVNERHHRSDEKVAKDTIHSCLIPPWVKSFPPVSCHQQGWPYKDTRGFLFVSFICHFVPGSNPKVQLASNPEKLARALWRVTEIEKTWGFCNNLDDYPVILRILGFLFKAGSSTFRAPENCPTHFLATRKSSLPTSTLWQHLSGIK